MRPRQVGEPRTDASRLVLYHNKHSRFIKKLEKITDRRCGLMCKGKRPNCGFAAIFRCVPAITVGMAVVFLLNRIRFAAITTESCSPK